MGLGRSCNEWVGNLTRCHCGASSDLEYFMCAFFIILTWGIVCVHHVKPAHFTSFWLEALYVCVMWNQHTLHHFDLRFCMCVMWNQYTLPHFDLSLCMCASCETSTLCVQGFEREAVTAVVLTKSGDGTYECELTNICRQKETSVVTKRQPGTVKQVPPIQVDSSMNSCLRLLFSLRGICRSID